MMQLFPKIRQPYVVWAPSYHYNSSGVRALHLLTHALNEIGEKAYLWPEHGAGYAVNPFLNTPLLSSLLQDQNFYANNGVEPIAIYPEKIVGNPLNTKKVVRWLLAPAGLYGGPTEFPGEDVWSFLPGIALSQGNNKVLRVPVSDTNIFYPPVQDSFIKRSGKCYYAHKYDLIHGNRLLPITDGMVRIQDTPEKVANLLRGSEACYTYENSQIIQEAQLCGCPVVLIRSEYFNKFPEAHGHIPYGVRWHDEADNTYLAEGWVDRVLEDYKKIGVEFEGQLERFVRETQSM